MLDLGCGNGKLSEPFFQSGYKVTLVDKDIDALQEAENNLKKIRENELEALNVSIEDFKFDKSYDGIIISNALPFQKSKESIIRIVQTAWEKVNKGGFFYLTLFGVNDEWAKEHVTTMTFHTKDEALSILKESPYYLSEDFGQGSTMKGGMKTWHIFSLLYIK